MSCESKIIKREDVIEFLYFRPIADDKTSSREGKQ